METGKNKAKTGLCKALLRTFALGALRPHAKSILPILNRPHGKFVEVGARDGGKESFTPFLEKALGWEGLLIEPWPHLFHKCRKRRKNSVSLNVAAVDQQLHDSFIEIEGRPPAVSIKEQLRMESKLRAEGRPVFEPPPLGRKRGPISYVTTNQLTAILDKANFERSFELMILNLNGYERQALEGMNFDRYRPTFLLIRSDAKSELIPNVPAHYKRILSSKHDEETQLHLFHYADFGLN